MLRGRWRMVVIVMIRRRKMVMMMMIALSLTESALRITSDSC